MTKEIEQIKISAYCPICNKAISHIWIARLDSVIGTRYAYICCKCKNLLKISKEKLLDLTSNSTFSFSPTTAVKDFQT